MAKSNFKDPKDIREKMVHLAFSENEITKIDDFVEESNCSTRTEFIRQAIFEKINRIEMPELFTTKTVNNEEMVEFLNDLRVNNEQIKKLLKNLPILFEIKETLREIKTRSSRPEIEKNKKIIIKLLKEHKHLKPLKIMELSGLASHDVYDVISDESLFIINLNGEVELK